MFMITYICDYIIISLDKYCWLVIKWIAADARVKKACARGRQKWVPYIKCVFAYIGSSV